MKLIKYDTISTIQWSMANGVLLYYIIPYGLCKRGITSSVYTRAVVAANNYLVMVTNNKRREVITLNIFSVLL